MALFDISIDEVDTIIEIRTKALELLKEGASVMSWNSEGTSVTKQFTLPIRTVLEETKLYLQQYDPDLYGSRITRTVPSYMY